MRVLSKPVEKLFKLKTDPDGEATITVRQATFGDNKQIADLTAKTIRRWSDREAGPIELEQEFNYLEERALRIYLTVTNISGILDDETSQPLFEFKEFGKVSRPKSKDNFFGALEKLPNQVVEEMHQCVLDMNPQWDPTRQGE